MGVGRAKGAAYTLALSFHGDLDGLGEFSFHLLVEDANGRTLSMQRVIAPNGARTREVTLMGVDASKIRAYEVDLLTAMTADGSYLGELEKRYTLVVEDKR